MLSLSFVSIGLVVVFLLGVLAIIGLVWRQFGVLAAIGLVAALGGLSTWATRDFLLKQAFPDCVAAEKSAQASGDLVLYDCDSLGLAINFPIAGTLAALLLVVAIAGFRRLFLRR